MWNKSTIGMLLFFSLVGLIVACGSSNNSENESEPSDDDDSGGLADDDATADDDSTIDDDAQADDDSAESDDDSGGDDDIQDDDSGVDDDIADDDSALDDDSAADDDSGDDDSGAEQIFHNPHDGLLYVAAGYAVITPNDQNHPCPKFMGGYTGNRIATGTHDELEARALVMELDGVHIVLVSLDLVGLMIADIDKVLNALEEYGVDRKHVIISCTHTHEGPDTLGLWGPDPFHTGRCPEYVDFLAVTITDLIVQIAGQMVPATVRSAETQINEPGSNHPNLTDDFRYPYVFNDHLTSFIFENDSSQAIATLVNWHSHPEVLIAENVYSSDFPRWCRKKLEEEFGGTCVYFSGTVGGLTSPLGVSMPERTADGVPVLNNGQQVFVYDDNEIKAWSLGYVIGEYVTQALDSAPATGTALAIESTIVNIPFTNPLYILAELMGIIAPYGDFITDQPWICGLYGCVPQPIIHVQLGATQMISLPGEAFPETSVGRPEFTYDWGDPWGEHTYPAIQGYRDWVPEGQLLIEFGLADNEFGYLVPQFDFEPPGHPNYYEEQDCVTHTAETLVREAVIGLLDQTSSQNK